MSSACYCDPLIEVNMSNDSQAIKRWAGMNHQPSPTSDNQNTDGANHHSSHLAPIDCPNAHGKNKKAFSVKVPTFAIIHKIFVKNHILHSLIHHFVSWLEIPDLPW